MTLLSQAKDLARLGFHVFPVRPNSKLPQIKKFPELATRDEKQLNKWWAQWPTANIGISTSRFGDGTESLLVVDVDNSKGKKGDDELLRLEIEGREFPQTFEQRTPTGGRHLIYRVSELLKQGANVLGAGIDTRARGGYVVGAGSSVRAGTYTAIVRDVGFCPDWIIEACGRSTRRTDEQEPAVIRGVDPVHAANRAIEYLELHAPIAAEGNGGDQTTFQVAARVKDLGCTRAQCLELMLEHWNDRCEPPWLAEELGSKVANAYRYGENAVGFDAPEAQFDPVPAEPESLVAEEAKLHPFDELNKEYAFVLMGSTHAILWETVDSAGLFEARLLSEESFHKDHAHKVMLVENKLTPTTRLWLKDPARRRYKGLCFNPGLPTPEGWYNLWRGFSCEPQDPGVEATPRSKAALQAFLDHALENVCAGDESLYQWLIGYFAHLIQRPWEMPLTALVFRGRKGVGKNALIDRVGNLFGGHYMTAANRRHLVGNFNVHLENVVLFTLDEAFWSGDKQIEGVLKSLITAPEHLIERKGLDVYKAKSRLRVCIIGNEDWLVPASHDERRYAVFDVGEGRKQDRGFFREMREGMEAGGNRLLLRYLMDFDLSQIDVGEAPKTKGLLHQKIQSQNHFDMWWFECLSSGKIHGDNFGEEWPKEFDRDAFHNAYRQYLINRGVNRYLPTPNLVGREAHNTIKGLKDTRPRDGSNRRRCYELPPLDDARKHWEARLGHSITWESFS